MKHNRQNQICQSVESPKGHPIFGVVSLPPKDWPCNCVNTPGSGAASTAASTSPIRIKHNKTKTHTEQKFMFSIF